MVPVFCPLLLPHRDTGRVGTGKQGRLGAPCRHGMARTRDVKVARGEGEVGCLALGWGADVCVGAGRRGGHRADRIGEGETKAGRTGAFAL